MSGDVQALASTASLCPTCLEPVPGTYEKRDGGVYLTRECPDHGQATRRVWDDYDHWEWAGRVSPEIEGANSAVECGCDPESGCRPEETDGVGDLTVDHDRACVAVVEVTQDCNLSCSYCFASSGPGGKHRPQSGILEQLEAVVEGDGLAVQQFLTALSADPWRTAEKLVDGPLYPGGSEATEALLDRAGVGPGTRLLDVGCGAGDALALARDRGAAAVGLDRAPRRPGTVRGTFEALPVRDGAVDVVLAECALCLAADLDAALAETRRALAADGRLVVSDVVLEGEVGPLPDGLAELCCLPGGRSRADLEAAVAGAGYEVADVRDHHDDLVAMADGLRARVDYERLRPLLGDRGEELLDGIERLEAALADRRLGYVSLVARPGGEDLAV